MRERYARHLIGKTRKLPHLPIGNMLVIAPHHDDEVLGTGLAIRRSLRAGYRVDVTYIDTVPERWRESQKALDALQGFNRDLRGSAYMESPNTYIPIEDRVMVAIGNALVDRLPNIVLIPHALESHPEHLAVRSAALSVLRGWKPTAVGGVAVYGYAVWAWHTWPFVSLLAQNDWALRRASILASWRTRGGRGLVESFTHRVVGGYDAKKDALACFRSQHVSAPGHASLGDLGLLDWRWIEGFTRESV